MEGHLAALMRRSTMRASRSIASNSIKARQVRQVFYRVIADRVQMQCIAHGAMDLGQGKGLDETQDLHVFSLAGPHSGSSG